MKPQFWDKRLFLCPARRAENHDDDVGSLFPVVQPLFVYSRWLPAALFVSLSLSLSLSLRSAAWWG